MPDDLGTVETIKNSDIERVNSFKNELTQLSIKLGIGIANPITLFVMERDDYDRKYILNAGDLEFV